MVSGAPWHSGTGWLRGFRLACDSDHPDRIGRTVWAMFPPDADNFGQSASPFMINYRVSNLERMLEQLRRGGVEIEKVEDYDYGRFAWITDPEGNRIELWEPVESG